MVILIGMSCAGGPAGITRDNFGNASPVTQTWQVEPQTNNVDVFGNPIPTAPVYRSSFPAWTDPVHADRFGPYWLEAIVYRGTEVARAPLKWQGVNFWHMPRDEVQLVPNEGRVYEFNLERGGKLELRLVDEVLTPIPNLNMEWEDCDPRRPRLRGTQRQTAVTDANGFACFNPVFPGTQRLRILGDVPGNRTFFGCMLFRRQEDPNVVSATLNLAPPFRVHGKVVEDYADPASFSPFTMMGSGMVTLVSEGVSPVTASGWFGADGYFQVMVPFEGAYRVSELAVYEKVESSFFRFGRPEVKGNPVLHTGQPPVTIRFVQKKDSNN